MGQFPVTAFTRLLCAAQLFLVDPCPQMVIINSATFSPLVVQGFMLKAHSRNKLHPAALLLIMDFILLRLQRSTNDSDLRNSTSAKEKETVELCL